MQIINSSYGIHPAITPPLPEGLWDDAVWGPTPALAVDCFRPEGSHHRPRTLCKLLYNEEKIFGIFRVEDQFVRCRHTAFQSDVWKDSCVEFFVQPQNCKGYFNFEFNCGGALLASYVTDPTRVNGRLAQYTPLGPDDDRKILRHASQPPVVEPETTAPLTWYLGFVLPFAVMEKYAGPREDGKPRIWRGNFYKCGNDTSHPHWASWQPLAGRNFHDPDSFGELVFVPRAVQDRGQR